MLEKQAYEKIKGLSHLLEDYECCICLDLLTNDPVIVKSTGLTYHRHCIESHFSNQRRQNFKFTDPKTNQPVQDRELVKNVTISNLIHKQLAHYIRQIFALMTEFMQEKQIVLVEKLIGKLQKQQFYNALNHEQKKDLAAIENKLLDSKLDMLSVMLGGSFLTKQMQLPFVSQISAKEDGVREKLFLFNFIKSLDHLMCDQSSLFALFKHPDKPIIAKVMNQMKQWLSFLDELSLICLESSEKRRNEAIEKYVKKIRQLLENGTEDVLIPNGVFGTSLDAGLAIVQPKLSDSKQVDWIQVMLGSEYHQYLGDTQEIKSRSILELKNVEISAITPFLLTSMTEIKILPGAACDSNANVLYELILAKLNVKGNFLNSEEALQDKHFYTHRDYVHCQSWYVVKCAFSYLVQKNLNGKADDLLEKIFFSIDFHWLEAMDMRFQQVVAQKDFMLADAYAYLVRDLIGQLSRSVVSYSQENSYSKFDTTQLMRIVNRFRVAEKSIQGYQEKRHQLTGSIEKIIPMKSVWNIPLPSQKDILSAKQNVEQRDRVLLPILNPSSLKLALDKFNLVFVNPLKARYSFHHVQKFLDGIELFFFECLVKPNKPLDRWCDTVSAEEANSVAIGLLELASRYYDLQLRVMIYQKSDAYDPTIYTKVITLIFSVYMCLDVLARRDPMLYNLLIDQKLSLQANKNHAFKKIFSTLILPDDKWGSVLLQLRSYMQKKGYFDHGDPENALFGKHNENLFFEMTEQADSDNVNVRFAMRYLDLDANLPVKDHFESRTLQINEEALDQNLQPSCAKKWTELFFSHTYLPIIFCQLRDAAVLSKIALLGMSDVTLEATDIRDSYDKNIKVDTIGCAFYGVGYNFTHENRYSNIQIRTKNFSLSLKKKYPISGYLLPGGNEAQSSKQEDRKKFQRLIFKVSKKNEDEAHARVGLSENKVLATQNKQPSMISRSDYLQLGFLRSEPYLIMSRIYIGLKTKLLSFEQDEHAYLMKQALFQLNIAQKKDDLAMLWLTEQCQRSNLSEKFIEILGKKGKSLLEKVAQHRALQHLVEILTQLHGFLPKSQQNRVQAILDELRNYMMVWITQNPEAAPVPFLQAYILLSYDIPITLEKKDIQSILAARVGLEKSASKGKLYRLPTSLFLQSIRVMHRKENEIDAYLIRDSSVLDSVVLDGTVSLPGAWERTSKNLYSKKSYVIDLTRGRIYVQGQTRFPVTLYNHADYRAAFGDRVIPMNLSERPGNRGPIICYVSVNKGYDLYMIETDECPNRKALDHQYQDKHLPMLIKYGKEIWIYGLDENGRRQLKPSNHPERYASVLNRFERKPVHQWKCEDNSIYKDIAEKNAHISSTVQWQRLTFNGNELFIEESAIYPPNEMTYQQFIPNRDLRSYLPRVLIEGYTHWFTGDAILIKDAIRQKKYQFNVKTKQLVSIENGQLVLPLHQQAKQHPNLLDFIQKIELPDYVLLLANPENPEIPVSIEFPRLKLSFTISKDGRLYSEQLKGCVVAEKQTLHTLYGLSQYWILESRLDPSTEVGMDKWVLIPNRDVMDRTAFFSKTIKLEHDILHNPPYFFYQIDLTLGRLKAETTAGRLYLALLYAKTASLDNDPLTLTSGYTHAMEILSTCWQNVPYDSHALGILIRILSTQNARANQSRETILNANEMKAYDRDTSSVVESFLKERPNYHPQAIVVWLRSLYLLASSLRMHFLHKSEYMMPLIEKGKEEQIFYFRAYFPSYFARYLSVKSQLSTRDCLTPIEEDTLLSVYSMGHGWFRSADELRYIFDKERLLFNFIYENYRSTTPLCSPKASDFREIETKLFAQDSLNKHIFSDEMKKFLNRRFGYSLSVLSNRQSYHLFNSITYQFDFSHFLSFYAKARQLDSEKEREQFEYQLHAFALLYVFKAKGNSLLFSEDEVISLLSMLFIVAAQPPSKFPVLPRFLLSDRGDVEVQSGTFYFQNQRRNLSQASNEVTVLVNKIEGFSREEKEEWKKVLWENITFFDLKKDGRVKWSVVELKQSGFLLDCFKKTPQLAAAIPSFIQKKIQDVVLRFAMNEEVYQFLLQIGADCDRYKVDIGKSAYVNKIRSLFKPREIKPPHLHPLTQNKVDDRVFNKVEDRLLPNDSLHKEVTQQFISIRKENPQPLSFPLRSFKHQNTEISEQLSGGYGRTFVDEMLESWNSYSKKEFESYDWQPNKIETLGHWMIEKLSVLQQEIDVGLKSLINCLDELPRNDPGYDLALLRFAGESGTISKMNVLRQLGTMPIVVYSQHLQDCDELGQKLEKYQKKLKALQEKEKKIRDENLGKKNKKQEEKLGELNRKITELTEKIHDYQLEIDEKIKIANELKTQISTHIQNLNPLWSFDQIKSFYRLLTDYVYQQAMFNQLKRAYRLFTQYKVAQPSEQPLFLRELSRTLLAQSQDFLINHPRWPLFELENNLIIREQQSELALQMAKEKNNTLYQLNMGEGKSSVIAILLTDILGKSESWTENSLEIEKAQDLRATSEIFQKNSPAGSSGRLMRITVLESLLPMMQTLLTEKFSGLMNKRVYVMPFSRSVDTSQENLEKIKQELLECQSGKHILLMTPEHRLCFQLKLEEVLVEYLACKDADNTFNWSNYCERRYYYLENGYYKTETVPISEDIKVLVRNALITLGYLNEKETILKFPTHYQTLLQEIRGITGNQPCLDSVYDELLRKSWDAKNKIEVKLRLLSEIDAISSVDILDESDEILRYGSELNYTLGKRDSLEGEAVRWKVPELLFHELFFNKAVLAVLEEGKSLGHVIFNPEYHGGSGVPLIRFLNQTYYNESIKTTLLNAFLEAVKDDFYKANLSTKDMDLELFISGKCDTNREKEIIQTIESRVHTEAKVLHLILLAKGWLSHGILYHVLSHRYRVEYGLNYGTEGILKKNMAVPFKGKDAPAERSEFGHPDVMLGFTLLSYLYHGLSITQVQAICFKLQKEYLPERAQKEFGSWVEQSKLWIQSRYPETIPKQFNGFGCVDPMDHTHVERLWEGLKRNQAMVYFYLNHFVFPEEAKQYKEKITGNAITLAVKPNTMGFSGTDDRKITMPFAVDSKTADASTNGKMLHILTRPVNQNYRSVAFVEPDEFLDQVCAYMREVAHCTVLIDSGALVTQFSNNQVARYLLRHLSDRFAGCIYCDDKTGQLVVLLKDNRVVSLLSCHLPKESLITYLDDTHTRGTDLKLTPTARGIVTVGRDMDKDKLMQAIMRLRQLDDGQSICLFVPKELSKSVAALLKISEEEVGVLEILQWVTYNTVMRIKREGIPWYIQNVHGILKERALSYQKRSSKPVQALINFVKDPINTDPRFLYGLSPVNRKPDYLVEKFVVDYYEKFWEPLQSNQSEGSFNTLIEFFKFEEENLKSVERTKKWHELAVKDKEEDKKLSKKIGKTIKKLFIASESVASSRSSLGEDQEKEVEVEVIQKHEVPLPTKQIPNTEVVWDFSNVLNQDFVTMPLKNDKPKEIYLLVVKDSSAINNVSYLLKSFHIQSLEVFAYIRTPEGLYYFDGYDTERKRGIVKITYLNQDKLRIFDNKMKISVTHNNNSNPKKPLSVQDLRLIRNIFQLSPMLHPINVLFEKDKKLAQLLSCIPWYENILLTENFVNTIELFKQDTNVGDYIRPVDCILVHYDHLILISGYEANELMTILEENPNPHIGLVHLRDINGPTNIPVSFKINDEKLKDILVLIKVMNGECYYDEIEIGILKRLFGKIEDNVFMSSGVPKETSKQYVDELKNSNLLSYSGFFTKKLCDRYLEGDAHEGGLKIPVTGTQCIDDQSKLIENALEKTLKESIIGKKLSSVKPAEAVTTVKRFFEIPGAVKELVVLHGRVKEYQGSVLEEKVLMENRMF